MLFSCPQLFFQTQLIQKVLKARLLILSAKLAQWDIFSKHFVNIGDIILDIL